MTTMMKIQSKKNQLKYSNISKRIPDNDNSRFGLLNLKK